MGLFSFLDPALEFIFGPLLLMPPFWAILIISLLISLLIVLIYKFTTKQELMKQLKEETRALQKQMKELKHDPQAAMKVQQRAMKANMQYMLHSLKPTLITFIPIILIFGWLNAHFAYEPIMPGQGFTITVNSEPGIAGDVLINYPEGLNLTGNTVNPVENNKAFFNMKAAREGDFLVEFSFQNKSYNRELVVSQQRKYSPPQLVVKDGKISTIEISNQPVIVANLFGWKIGWLGSYIILSIILSMLLRKIFKVY